MPDFTSLGKLYADVCVTYATLSIGYFILSRSEPFDFKGNGWKRIAFGLIAGVAALFLSQDRLILNDNVYYSFEMLPMILVTFFGGWLSGLSCYLLLFVLNGGYSLNNVLIGCIMLGLFLFRVWRKRQHRVFYITLLMVGLVRIALVSSLYGRVVPWATLVLYQLVAAGCMILCYHALNFKEIYMKKVFAIRVKAATDPLTQISNRASLDYRLSVQQTRRQSCGLIIIDIDNFKRVNDNYGHLIGDRVLSEIGRVLRNVTRSKDLAGRYGGEEFLVITAAFQPEAVMAIAERLRQEIEQNLMMLEEGSELQVTASLGVSLYLPGMQIRKAIKLADEALYKAKRQGKNQVVASTILQFAPLGDREGKA
jgi:diguanylate cyclase